MLVPGALLAARLDPLAALHVPAAWIGYLGAGFFTLLFVFTVLRDIGWFGLKGVEWAATEPGEERVADPRRRQILKIGLNGGVLTAATLATRRGFDRARGVPDVVELDVPIEGLPPDLEGFRIVQLSDLHVGETIRRPTVQAIADRVAVLDGDLIAITGDLAEGYVRHLRDDVEPLFELDAPEGIHYVTGNHEYYWEPIGWCRYLAERGIRVHNNDHAVVERGAARLVVAGCTDYKAGRHVEEHESDPVGAIEGAGDHDVSVLLAHQPTSLDQAVEAGYDLQLSGHTHGGQFWPWNYIAGFVHDFPAGPGRRGDTRIYVSRGTGYWGPPIRLAAPPEITVLTLRRAEKVREVQGWSEQR